MGSLPTGPTMAMIVAIALTLFWIAGMVLLGIGALHERAEQINRGLPRTSPAKLALIVGLWPFVAIYRVAVNCVLP